MLRLILSGIYLFCNCSLLRATKLIVKVRAVALFFALICTVMGARADVTVEANVDRNPVVLGDSFNLSVKVAADRSVRVGDPRWPQLIKFNILGRSQQMQSIFGSGGTVYTKTFHYSLEAKELGTHTLDPIEVIVSGEKYETSPIDIKVVKGNGKNRSTRRKGQPQQGHPGSNLPSSPFSQFFGHGFPHQHQLKRSSGDVDFFIRSQVDKTKVYVGEPIMVSWYIYTTGILREIDTLSYSRNKGFWKEDIYIATNLSFMNEVIEGVPYKKALLASYALFPLKEGIRVIDPYKVKGVLVEGSNFGFGRPVQKIRASEAISMEVLPLPEENKPTNFSGAVGKFNMSAVLNTSKLSVNEPVTLELHFHGQGNAKFINLPDLQLPPEFEIYDTKKKSKFLSSGRGERRFMILLIPRAEGVFSIPPIETSAFDPEKGEYYSLWADIPDLTVGPEKEGGVTLASSPLDWSSKKKEESLPGLIKSWKSYKSGGGVKLWSLVLIYVFIILFLIWRFVAELGWAAKKKGLHQLVRLRVEAVRHLIEEEKWGLVGTSVTNLVYRVIGLISGQGGGNLELDKLILEAPPSVRRDLGDVLKRQNKTFETLGFAPDEISSHLKDRGMLEKQLLEIEETLLAIIDLAS